MEIIGSLLEDYLKRFKVFYPQILFEPDWKLLKKYRCPLCGNYLKFMRMKEFAYCKGKKHKKGFLISNKKLNEITCK